MDLNSIMKLMTSSDALGQVSSLTGVSEKEAGSALEEIVPMLLKGMQGQAILGLLISAKECCYTNSSTKGHLKAALRVLPLTSYPLNKSLSSPRMFQHSGVF